MLARCKICKRWEHLNSKGLCESCREDEPEATPTNDGNCLDLEDE